jgi:hypothetical protein
MSDYRTAPPTTAAHGLARRTLPRLAAVLGLIAAGATLLACGGSGSATAASATQDAFKFSQCMREHGITNFPDPETGAGGAVRLQFKTGAKLDPHTLEVAQNACKKYSPVEREKLTPAQKVEREEAVQKFAKCMREHGINLPTPTTSGGGLKIELGKPGSSGGPGNGGPNPESPAFQAAQKACQGLLPKRPPGAGGAGGGPQTSKGAGGGSGFSLSAGG